MIGYNDVRQWCDAGELITDGPLNRTFRVFAFGNDLFVRERVLRDSQYAQTFAGERFLPRRVHDLVAVPKLHFVQHDRLDRETFAVFEYIQGESPDWTKDECLASLANALVRVHSVPGAGFGDVGSELKFCPPELFLSELLNVELKRLANIGSRDMMVGLGNSEVAEAFSVFAGEPGCLIHGDVHSGNFLIDASGTLWLVDWEAARYRVAAADFNQMSVKWLDSNQEAAVIDSYVEISGREMTQFVRQIQLLRTLWHVRTYNFKVNILGNSFNDAEWHLEEARRQFKLATV